MGEGLKGKIKKVREEKIRVKVKKDKDEIKRDVYEMVKNFNGLMKTAKEFGSDRGEKVLKKRLDKL